ncbi:co-chaperone HscB [Enterovibrio norvegicus]|uniref:Co-chaperone protein HscB homolog n=1 Tax=Enterovibrio norvegicus TaxID=188144 RepID=A0ABV4L0G2_9GAMM|nr:co-chaperone HscB [Enterovibrio norvegicus]MCC4799901.1 co-chaperone HscB [Enterovibrio norvegicus]OEE46741.1 co-chaperone HscB [Enterovibrio norvegicus]OEF54948.1 co-chaperone HscB [Enterovibrio norvegicus]PMI33307.1 co-chaperone HscB [Enterovibrio norvegicus]PMI36210.1 co-chaperone HscB [Enterovibrio norvegicus]
MNHFELFGLSSQFDLDGSSLSSQFRELQRRFHPDKFATASEQERLLAVQKAAQINDAYQTLSDPVRRAEYLLALNGLELRDETQTMQDPEFLMQQMEMREALEDIADSNEPDVLLFDFEEKTVAIHQSLLIELKDALNSAQWETAAVLVRKLKFLVKLKQEIERIEDRLLG